MPKQKKHKRDNDSATVLRFSDDHLWVRAESDRAQIGISDQGQDSIGEIIAVELPDVGDSIERGEAFGELESVRTIHELIAPVTGFMGNGPALSTRIPQQARKAIAQNWSCHRARA